MQKVKKAILATVMVGSTVFGGLDVSWAQNAPTNEELAKRMEALQMQLDALIKLQTKNAEQTATPSTPAGSSTSSQQTQNAGTTTPASGYRKGLTLDLYLQADLGPDDMGRLLPIPKDLFPSASTVVSPTGGFEWSAFTEVDQMKRFTERMEKRVSLNWSGYIDIPATGAQVFALEIAVDRNSGTISCIANVTIDQREVVRVLSANHYSDSRLSNNQGSINLAAGYHEFSLFGYCNGSNPKFDRVRFNVLTKGPTDRAPTPVTSDRFVTKG